MQIFGIGFHFGDLDRALMLLGSPALMEFDIALALPLPRTTVTRLRREPDFNIRAQRTCPRHRQVQPRPHRPIRQPGGHRQHH